MITHKQLSFANVFSDCKEKFETNKYQFLSLLENTINLDDLVPVSYPGTTRGAEAVFFTLLM